MLEVRETTSLLNKNECTMDQELSDAAYAPAAGQTLRVNSPDGSTFMRQMTSWPPS